MGVVTGVVTDGAGAPVAGVPVYANSVHGRFGAAPHTHTGRDGRWRLTLADGQWTVRELGHRRHDVTVTGLDVDLERGDPATTTPTDPAADLARVLARRRLVTEP